MLKFIKVLIILAHAFAGWLLCDATMVIGMAYTSIENALLIHLIGAPVYFTIVSLFYFRHFNYTNPLATAFIFTGFVIVVDFFFVALIINRSLEMFASVQGTWIPFLLIFISTFASGKYAAAHPHYKHEKKQLGVP